MLKDELKILRERRENGGFGSWGLIIDLLILLCRAIILKEL